MTYFPDEIRVNYRSIPEKPEDYFYLDLCPVELGVEEVDDDSHWFIPDLDIFRIVFHGEFGLRGLYGLSPLQPGN